MINRYSTLKFLFSITLLILSSGLSVWLFIFEKYFYLSISICIVLYSIHRLLREYKNSIRKISFMFNAIECDDYSFKFSERTRNIDEGTMNASLNRIKDVITSARERAIEREKYYELIINRVRSGIITINDNGNVYLVNNEAMHLFGLKVFTHVNQLRLIEPKLPNVFKEISPQERRVVSFNNERGEISLVLNASEMVLDGKKLKIVSINDINNDLDEKEIESWLKLIRVLTHEIMNSLAPITSLSQTLLEISIDNDSDITKGLETINYTSKSLVEFVESYSKFTRIQNPIKEPFEIRPMIESTTKLVCGSDVELVIDINPGDIMVYADENLITQVLLNIVKNGAQAISDNEIKRIEVNSYIEQDESVVVKVTNNGLAIPKDIVTNIFMPFYTTKESGTGIGLSISRQIMHLHRGEVRLTENRNGCVTFSLIFT